MCPRLHAWHRPFCRFVSNLPGALWHRPGSGVRWKTPCPPASSAGGSFTTGPPGREVPSQPSKSIYPETVHVVLQTSLDHHDGKEGNDVSSRMSSLLSASCFRTTKASLSLSLSLSHTHTSTRMKQLLLRQRSCWKTFPGSVMARGNLSMRL